jgi:hypothetical protein
MDWFNQTAFYSDSKLCGSIGRKYTDKWGEIWTRATDNYVVRDSDRNVGGWFKGEGLVLIFNSK